jgi:DNA polymerase-3 subunit epsilon
MLRGKPSPAEAWPWFVDFVGNSPLVAHNSPFDSGFIRHELALLGMRLRNPWHCTVRLARKHLPQLPNHRLETVARHLLGDIPADCRLHRALGDARLAARVWIEMMNNP